MKIYEGSRANPEEETASDVLVTVNGNPLSPAPSLKIVNHSPTGFAWGYYGSGPAQLALAILLDCMEDKDIATRYYQDFKSEVVSQFGDKWKITEAEIQDFLFSKIKIPNLNSNAPSNEGDLS
jgi:hypothetical protein